MQTEIEKYSKLILKDPNNAELYYLRSKAYISENNWELALVDINEAIKKKPNDDRYLHNRGFCKQKLGNYEEAIEAYLKALKVDFDSLTLLNLANCYFEVGNYEAAEEYYEKALRAHEDGDILENVNLLLCYSDLINIYNAQKRPDKVVEYCNHILNINPTNQDALYNRGIAYLNLTQPQQAVETFNRYIQLAPDDPEGNLFLGIAYLKLGNSVAAFEHFSHTLKYSLKIDQVISIAKAYSLHQNVQISLQDLTKFINSTNNEVYEAIFRFCRAEIYKKQGNPNVASQDYEAIIRLLEDEMITEQLKPIYDRTIWNLINGYRQTNSIQDLLMNHEVNLSFSINKASIFELLLKYQEMEFISQHLSGHRGPLTINYRFLESPPILRYFFSLIIRKPNLTEIKIVDLPSRYQKTLDEILATNQKLEELYLKAKEIYDNISKSDTPKDQLEMALGHLEQAKLLGHPETESLENKINRKMNKLEKISEKAQSPLPFWASNASGKRKRQGLDDDEREKKKTKTSDEIPTKKGP